MHSRKNFNIGPGIYPSLTLLLSSAPASGGAGDTNPSETDITCWAS